MRQDPRFPNLFIVDHPLVQHKLSYMRDVETSTRTFRQLLRELTLLMGYELTRDLPLSTKRIETPITAMDAPVIAGKKIAVVPVLRAGIGHGRGLARVDPVGAARPHRPVPWCGQETGGVLRPPARD